MTVPTVFAAALDPAGVAQRFFVPAVAIGVIGVNLIFAFKGPAISFGRRQTLLLMAAVWIVVPVACSFPFMMLELPNGFMGAYFESVSGFTTTGATIFTDPEGCAEQHHRMARSFAMARRIGNLARYCRSGRTAGRPRHGGR